MSQIICAHIEYKQHRYVHFAQVRLERDYDFLALLGGGPRQNAARTLFLLRGMPPDADDRIKMAFYYVVSEHKTDRERYVSRREAEAWVARGDAKWVGPDLVSDPDYFSPRWVFTEELDQAYAAYQSVNAPRLFTVEATLAAMRILPEARSVFWFGN